MHFGESLQLAALGIVGQIIQTSATISDALTNACALVRFTTDMFDMQIQHDDKRFFIYLISEKRKAEVFPFTYRHTADYLMVFIIHELDGLLLEKTLPLEVGFPYYLASPYEYARVFRCSNIKKAPELELKFSSKNLSLPILSANYELQTLLLQKMNTLILGNDDKLKWHNKVYNYLLTNSYLNTLSIESVANNFTMGPRSLQRKLKEEGFTYLQIADKVRKKITLQYMENPSLSIKDITNMLGFKEQSAFLRAFKRWTGKTPSDYKQKL